MNFKQNSRKNCGSTVYTCSGYGDNRSYFIRSYPKWSGLPD